MAELNLETLDMNQEERDIWKTAAVSLPNALAAADDVRTAHKRLRELELHDREHKLQVADAVEAVYLNGCNPAQDEKVREISAAAPDARHLLRAQKRCDLALLYFRSKLSPAVAPVHSATNQKLLAAIAGLRQDFADFRQDFANFRRDAASSKREILTIAALGVIQEWNTRRAKERNLMASNAYHYALLSLTVLAFWNGTNKVLAFRWI
ncbi:hypothetical protein AMAG_11770 [Allomyces macrogynus ATCC 38327]|uniref:Uncharacterized protein n=1 Tax=Allomyces macrogynus (strain ATCC 38327) TaxID=578462 RepID=A0A0L0SW92_ALLM3|nr:hypothetical protein AMAG_11770 [Allomyces macrogynus ATCC 38327]|eukprot:KNE66655.1 hypothetical protein AMAG_11770 [Allomyces macrogynus ATCC 38327]